MGRRWVTFLLYNILVRVSLSTAITEKARVTDLVFLDIDIGKEEAGRIVIGLFGATSPKTVQNFISLAKHEVEMSNLVKNTIISATDLYLLHFFFQYGYGYRETIFHRIINGFMMQGCSYMQSHSCQLSQKGWDSPEMLTLCLGSALILKFRFFCNTNCSVV